MLEIDGGDRQQVSSSPCNALTLVYYTSVNSIFLVLGTICQG